MPSPFSGALYALAIAQFLSFSSLSFAAESPSAGAPIPSVSADSEVSGFDQLLREGGKRLQEERERARQQIDIIAGDPETLEPGTQEALRNFGAQIHSRFMHSGNVNPGLKADPRSTPIGVQLDSRKLALILATLSSQFKASFSNNHLTDLGYAAAYQINLTHTGKEFLAAPIAIMAAVSRVNRNELAFGRTFSLIQPKGNAGAGFSLGTRVSMEHLGAAIDPHVALEITSGFKRAIDQGVTAGVWVRNFDKALNAAGGMDVSAQYQRLTLGARAYHEQLGAVYLASVTGTYRRGGALSVSFNNFSAQYQITENIRPGGGNKRQEIGVSKGLSYGGNQFSGSATISKTLLLDLPPKPANIAVAQAFNPPPPVFIADPKTASIQLGLERGLTADMRLNTRIGASISSMCPVPDLVASVTAMRLAGDLGAVFSAGFEGISGRPNASATLSGSFEPWSKPANSEKVRWDTKISDIRRWEDLVRKGEKNFYGLTEDQKRDSVLVAQYACELDTAHFRIKILWETLSNASQTQALQNDQNFMGTLRRSLDSHVLSESPAACPSL